MGQRPSASLLIQIDPSARGELQQQIYAGIRRAILGAAPSAVEIGDRTTAINQAIQGLNAGDVLLIAGKGHETGQIVGDKIIPFSDHDAVAAALGEASD